MAYKQSKLSAPREDDQLPPLDLYLKDLAEMQKREKEKKEHNPDYDTLFGDEPPKQEEAKKEEPIPEEDV